MRLGRAGKLCGRKKTNEAARYGLRKKLRWIRNSNSGEGVLGIDQTFAEEICLVNPFLSWTKTFLSDFIISIHSNDTHRRGKMRLGRAIYHSVLWTYVRPNKISIGARILRPVTAAFLDSWPFLSHP